MVRPVEVCEQHTAEPIVDFVDAHTNGAHAVAVSRRSYTIKEKRELVQAISALASNGVSIRQACPLFGVPHQYYYRFKKVVKVVDDLEASGVFVPYRTNGTARKIHPGRPRFLPQSAMT